MEQRAAYQRQQLRGRYAMSWCLGADKQRIERSFCRWLQDLRNWTRVWQILLAFSVVLQRPRCVCPTLLPNLRIGFRLCQGALDIALKQVTGANGWYTSKLELQLTSLQLCVACRKVPTFHLTVERDVLAFLWPNSAAEATRSRAVSLGRSRVPALRPRKVTWNLAALSMRHCGNAFESVDALVFGDSFDYRVDRVTWPPRLEKLVFGKDFDRLVDHVVWPRSLKQLTFGTWFNKSIGSVSCCDSLQQITFGTCFNQPVEDVSWPASLQELTFGKEFSQPIQGVKWSASLQKLTFGRYFNQPIDRVTFPASLRQITFGFSFNQPITDVMWPVSLKRLVFGYWFNHEVEDVSWPASLEELSFGIKFQVPVGDIDWPDSLQRLTIAHRPGMPLHT